MSKEEQTKKEKKKKELDEAKKQIKKSQDELLEQDQEIIKQQEEAKKEESEEKEEESLEETLANTRAEEIPPEIANSQYAAELSQEPMQDLKKEMTDIYQAVEEKGYINQEEERRVEYLSSAVERKLEDVETGKYSFTAEVAQAASLTQQLGSGLRSMYKGSRSKEEKMYKIN